MGCCSNRQLNDENQQEICLKQSVEKQKSKEKKGSFSESDQDDENQEEIIEIKPNNQKKSRSSVSAEVYGAFNKKGNFKPRVINKNNEQKEKIKSKLEKAFMFQPLDQSELIKVIMAMDILNFKEGEYVIKQGEDGDNLYVVDEGELDCYKKFSRDQKEDTYLKTYLPGESFGELALLYNAPRAASIKVKKDATLFALDRETFNNIVKDAAAKKREKYEDFLQKIQILKNIDSYERLTIADALKSKVIKKGDYIFQQGDKGEHFFLLEEGEAECWKIPKEGSEAIKVMDYTAGSYFGELALMNDEPRQASIKAKTDVKAAYLDKDSFVRLLGPVDQILKREAEKYKKV